MSLILTDPDTMSLLSFFAEPTVLLEISSKIRLLTLGKQRQEDQKFTVILRPA